MGLAVMDMAMDTAVDMPMVTAMDTPMDTAMDTGTDSTLAACPTAAVAAEACLTRQKLQFFT